LPIAASDNRLQAAALAQSGSPTGKEAAMIAVLYYHIQQRIDFARLCKIARHFH
jgi:hypothetical protein